jgi:hypothetical protein
MPDIREIGRDPVDLREVDALDPGGIARATATRP